jgi:hypothetical protein
MFRVRRQLRAETPGTRLRGTRTYAEKNARGDYDAEQQLADEGGDGVQCAQGA